MGVKCILNTAWPDYKLSLSLSLRFLSHDVVFCLLWPTTSVWIDHTALNWGQDGRGGWIEVSHEVAQYVSFYVCTNTVDVNKKFSGLNMQSRLRSACESMAMWLFRSVSLCIFRWEYFDRQSSFLNHFKDDAEHGWAHPLRGGGCFILARDLNQLSPSANWVIRVRIWSPVSTVIVTICRKPSEE